MKIRYMRGREVYNSRGWPTVQCEIGLDDGAVFCANAPTGLSRGSYEARTLHDGGERLWGRGVRRAVEYIETLVAPEFVGEVPHAINADIKMLDLDGTPDKSRLGANTMLAVSMAMYRAHAHAERVELFEFIGHLFGADSVSIPFPMFNMIEGGMHAQNQLAIQEFLVVPIDLENFAAAMEVGAVVFHELGNVLRQHKKEIIFGDEGGYAPQFASEEEALDILGETLVKVHAQHGFSAFCALDVAASRLYDPATHVYSFGGKKATSDEMVDYYEKLISSYPISSIEDGLSENDWDGWISMTARLHDRVQLVGDDLFATNPQRILFGVQSQVATAVLIKPDQIGTVTEALQAIQVSKENGLITIVSHRSGDTEDTFIADLAVATSASLIKTGGLTRSERLAKYNRLLGIEDNLMREMQATPPAAPL
ncbi:MAG: phosphopyruvate hydratase [Candidatus Dependentiae bacterium]|nr:phosphopyruvate hydratase [Candidatus Dependentiae bacterium]